MGPSGVALAAVPVCAAWSFVAYSLGLRQQVLPIETPARASQSQQLRFGMTARS